MDDFDYIGMNLGYFKQSENASLTCNKCLFNVHGYCAINDKMAFTKCDDFEEEEI